MSTLEDFIEMTGWGMFHQFLMGMTSASSFARAIGELSIPFAIPIASCDIKMDDSAMANVNLCFSLGMAFGGFMLCALSDLSGRKSMIPITLILIFGSNFAAGFTHGYFMIVLCAFVLGSGLVGNASCTKIHLAESLPVEKRGFRLVFPDLFWSIGYLLFSLFCWMMTPVILQHRNLDMRLATWRVIYGVSGAFSIMIACASALLQESPRYLLFKKQDTQAVETFKQMFAINNSKHAENFQVDEEILVHFIKNYNINDHSERQQCTEKIIGTINDIKKSLQILRKKEFFSFTIILSALKLTFMFSFIIINIWLAKTLDSNINDCKINPVEYLYTEEKISANKCSFKANSTLYKSFFIIAANILFGQIFLMLIIDRLGRKQCIEMGCIICGVCSIALVFARNIYDVKLALSALFMAFYSLSESALNVIIIEGFPTAIRGTAAGQIHMFGYIVNGFIKRYMFVPCQASFIFIGVLMFGASILACFLPDYTRRPMVE